MSPIDFTHNQIAINVSREMAVSMGWVQPTPEEAAKRDKELAEFRARKAAGTTAAREALTALALIDDPTQRAVLDLHEPDENGYCKGDDFGGFEGEAPEWPCRTVEVIARMVGVKLPDHWIIDWHDLREPQ